MEVRSKTSGLRGMQATAVQGRRKHAIPARLPARQSGAALLVFMMIVVLGLASYLLERLNRLNTSPYYSSENTRVLAQAKQALMGWSISHPSATNGFPGQLPYPDRNGDGIYDGISDCVVNLVNNVNLLGVFPDQGRINAVVCENHAIGLNLRDAAGQRLWYAVSRNLVFNPGAGAAAVNSLLLDMDPPPYPWITVRDAGGNVVSNRVAAVIIAPGEALDGQDRTDGAPAPDADKFLDDVRIIDPASDFNGMVFSNSDMDGCPDNDACDDGEDFIQGNESDTFNDRLVFITIDELMAKVEQRVLGEAAGALRQYRDDVAGFYPWLSPFNNPLLASRRMTGEATATSPDLVVGGINFDNSDTAAADQVLNRTQNSAWITGGVAGASVLLLPNDANNKFNDGDEYSVFRSQLQETGLAGVGSDSTNLIDTNREFRDLAVQPGQLLINLTDSAVNIKAGMIQRVDDNQLSVVSWPLPGDSIDDGETYRLGSRYGQADAGSTDTTLADGEAFFDTAASMQPGQSLFNLTDQSTSFIETVDSATALTLAGFAGGVANSLAAGDQYEAALFEAIPGSRAGRLPLMRFMQTFRSGFSSRWEFPLPAATIPAASIHSYRNRIPARVASSDGAPGINTVSEDDGVCLWMSRSVIACQARAEEDFLTGTAKQASGSGSINDPDNFNGEDWDIQAGDKVVINAGQPRAVTGAPAGNALSSVGENATDNVSVDDAYQVHLATSRFNSVTDTSFTLTSGDIAQLYDSTVDFPDEGVRVGDLAHNLDNDTWGRITNVGTHLLNLIMFDGGSFSFAENYAVYSRYVQRRRYTYNLAFTPANGTAVVAAGGRKTLATANSGAALAAVPAAAYVPAPGLQDAYVLLQDFDDLGNVVGEVRAVAVPGNDVKLEIAGVAVGMEVCEDLGQCVDPAQARELPAWFVQQGWHRLVYAAVAAGLAPGGAGNCAADCLGVENADGDLLRGDVEALVALPGAALLNQQRPVGSVCNPLYLCDYLEGENQTEGDDVFVSAIPGNLNNDQLRVVSP